MIKLQKFDTQTIQTPKFFFEHYTKKIDLLYCLGPQLQNYYWESQGTRHFVHKEAYFHKILHVHSKHDINYGVCFLYGLTSYFLIIMIAFSGKVQKGLKTISNITGLIHKSLITFNPFVHSAPFFYPLKILEKFTVSGVFMGQTKGAFGTNGLILITCVMFVPHFMVI